MQKWQNGILSVLLGVFSFYLGWGAPVVWWTPLYYLLALVCIIYGLYDIFAPATMLTCPKCVVKTRHYQVRDRRPPKRQVFKCDVCGTKITVSPPKAIQPAAPKPKVP